MVAKLTIHLLLLSRLRIGGAIPPYPGNENLQLGTGIFVHHRKRSAVKRVEFVSDRVSYIVLRSLV